MTVNPPFVVCFSKLCSKFKETEWILILVSYAFFTQQVYRKQALVYLNIIAHTYEKMFDDLCFEIWAPVSFVFVFIIVIISIWLKRRRRNIALQGKLCLKTSEEELSTGAVE